MSNYDHLVDFLDTAIDKNIKALPQLKFEDALVRRLVNAYCFEIEDAEQLVAIMDTSITDPSLTIEQIEVLANKFAELINKVWCAYGFLGRNPKPFMIEWARKATIKLE